MTQFVNSVAKSPEPLLLIRKFWDFLFCSVLCTFLMYDLNLPNSSPMQCPTRKEFIQRILPRLTILQDLAEKTEKGEFFDRL